MKKGEEEERKDRDRFFVFSLFSVFVFLCFELRAERLLVSLGKCLSGLK